MPETDREIRRHSSRAVACIVPFMFCLSAGLVAIALQVPMNPIPVGVTLIVGAVGWAWFFIASLKELDYLQKLKSARHYFRA